LEAIPAAMGGKGGGGLLKGPNRRLAWFAKGGGGEGHYFSCDGSCKGHDVPAAPAEIAQRRAIVNSIAAEILHLYSPHSSPIKPLETR
jgi:hypothetical protein